MIFQLDMASSLPIYLQLRNAVVLGVGRGQLKIGDRLPTVRQMAADTGINSMTVNKAYALLRQEGYIKIDRRHGATVSPRTEREGPFLEKLEAELGLLAAESALKGLGREDFLATAAALFDGLNICALPAGT